MSLTAEPTVMSGKTRNDTMNPLNSIPAAIVSGVVLAIIVFVIVPGSGFNEYSLARWLHILSGIMWIGLLYYVNVAQIPALAAAAADKAWAATLSGCATQSQAAPRAVPRGTRAARRPRRGGPAPGIWVASADLPRRCSDARHGR